MSITFSRTLYPNLCDEELFTCFVEGERFVEDGRYIFFENYNRDPAEENRDVVIQVIKLDARGEETKETLCMMQAAWSPGLINTRWEFELDADYEGNVVAEKFFETFKAEILKNKHYRKEILKSYKKEKELRGVSPNLQSRIKAGRNDPCPCGSGRKYKKCCLPKTLWQ